MENGYRLGRRIRDRREGLGLTQAEVARRLGLPGSVVSRWEIGGVTPNMRNLRLLADALDTDVAELLTEREII